jgi:choline dehydrogenase-like flavoprotein
VLFDGKRAVGVEFSRGGAVERADAAREVILSAGAIGSPHILQLSGSAIPSYLSEEADRRAIVGGLRLARRIFAAPALAAFVRSETLPGDLVQADDELLDYARRNGGTCYHASCTCMMGSHAMAVVDDELRVHGIDGLRVIDASVMPAVTSTNTNAPTIMIAEKGAALINGAARERLAA